MMVVAPDNPKTPVDTMNDAELNAAIDERFGVTQQALREAAKPLFMLMFQAGIRAFYIERDGTRASVSFE
jgi:hypothetical protein